MKILTFKKMCNLINSPENRVIEGKLRKQSAKKMKERPVLN